jgi:hypothetical protein
LEQAASFFCSSGRPDGVTIPQTASKSNTASHPGLTRELRCCLPTLKVARRLLFCGRQTIENHGFDDIKFQRRSSIATDD